MELKDKVVVITGGTKGLGKALAHSFSQRESQVVITSHESEPIETNIHYVRSDIRKEEDVKKLVQEVVEKYGHIDIWINNAGIWMPHSKIENLNTEKVKNVFETNMFGLMYGSREAMIQMRKQKEGIIVNILSSAALGGRPTLAGYSASKFAADGFTKALRLELEGSGVKVVAVYPGGMRTNLFDEEKPADFDQYMDQSEVAEKIIKNLESDNMQEEQILKRPK